MTSEQHQSIYDGLDLSPQYFVWCIGNKESSTIDDFVAVYITNMNYNYATIDPIFALMGETGMEYDEAETAIADGDYWVGDEQDADNNADESARSYCEDIMYDEIPEHLRSYFDSDKWVQDYLNSGRGNILSTYDGEERSSIVNDTEYFIYRLN